MRPTLPPASGERNALGDRALLDAARSGDDGALDALIDRYQPRVYRFGMKMCRNPEDAEDVSQETLMAMTRGLAAFRADASVSTWLYTIARSFCIKKRRRSKHAEEPLDSATGRDEPVDPARDPESELAGRQIEGALDRAISELPRKYREVLLLRDVEGLTAPEVGEVLHLGIDAVKSRLHRARIAVRDRIAPLLRIERAESEPGRGCPDILRLYSRELEGDVSPELCARMERHLSACPRCSAVCGSMKKTLALCKTMPAPAVPAEIRAALRASVRALLSETRG